MADALEFGHSLTQVAARFRVPIRELQRVVTPKRSLCRPSAVISPEMLAQAVELIRANHSFRHAASVIKAPLSSLTAVMIKNGYTAKSLRGPNSARQEKLDLAVTLYRQGVKIAEILWRTGLSESALYSHLRQQRIDRRQPRGGSTVRS
jgi:transposase-like protein